MVVFIRCGAGNAATEVRPVGAVVRRAVDEIAVLVPFGEGDPPICCVPRWIVIVRLVSMLLLKIYPVSAPDHLLGDIRVEIVKLLKCLFGNSRVATNNKKAFDNRIYGYALGP